MSHLADLAMPDGDFFGVPVQVPAQSIPSSVQVILAQAAEEDGADIDISGIEFDFVRSIRVWGCPAL